VIKNLTAKPELNPHPGLKTFLRQIYHNTDNGTINTMIEHYEDQVSGVVTTSKDVPADASPRAKKKADNKGKDPMYLPN